MTDKSGTDRTQHASPLDWSKMIGEYWNSPFNLWNGMFQMPEAQETPQYKGRVGESLQATVKMWQAMMGAMSQPAVLEQSCRIAQMTPDIAFGFAQSCLKGLTRLQTQVGEWLQNRGTLFSSADIQELDKELIGKWNETYENEFSQYLKLPQIGLGRLYQERALQATEKLAAFQMKLSEFLHMLYLPVEKSLKSLQDEMAEMTETGPLDEKPKTYYNLWIKLLEGHYMELFKQPEYAAALGTTLCAMNEYVDTRQAAVNDVLKQLNIPTHQDLDELYKEIYFLKKRVRENENK